MKSYYSKNKRLIPKSLFKKKAFEFFRYVEENHNDIYITDHGKPVIRITRYEPKKEQEKEIFDLYHSIIEYKTPFAPVSQNDWEALK